MIKIKLAYTKLWCKLWFFEIKNIKKLWFDFLFIFFFHVNFWAGGGGGR